MDLGMFGKYRLVRRLAGSGMGRVYLATDTQSNREIALKQIDLGTDSESLEVLDAERRGAQLQKRLSVIEPRVALIYEAGELDGFFFIAMEYVEGRDLSEVITNGPLPVQKAVAIAIDICEVLMHAHNFRAVLEGREYFGIVHGDIKPRNIRIAPDGSIKVLDFGIAKALSLTRKFTHNQFGSVPYSSPERLNTGDVDALSDVWSVSVVLFEMVTGRRYFQAENAAKLEHLIRNYQAVLDSLQAVPPVLRDILKRSLAGDARVRYQSADEFRADLQAFQEGRVPRAAAPDPDATRRTVADPLDARTRLTSSAATAKPVPRPKVSFMGKMMRLVMVGLLTLLAVVTYTLWHEAKLYSAGADLRHDLETEREKDLNNAWQRYQNLASQHPMPLVLTGTRNTLEHKLVASADRVITDYREHENAVVRSGDWDRARLALKRALLLSGGDKTIRAKMLLCEGHIKRINASGKNQGKMVSEAAAEFEEARDLMPHSADPHLGLARLYLTNLRDVDRAEQELRDAEKYGNFHRGRREMWLLGIAYRGRADELVRASANASGMPEEGEDLRHADEDYLHAEEMFKGAGFSKSVIDVLKLVRSSRIAIEDRMHSPTTIQPTAQ